jgi:hypothetical protein
VEVVGEILGITAVTAALVAVVLVAAVMAGIMHQGKEIMVAKALVAEVQVMVAVAVAVAVLGVQARTPLP